MPISEGVRMRAQIDTESVRAVMLVTGGGCIALLALLPTIAGTRLVVGMMWTFACWLASLTLVLIHNVLRRHCSNIYQWHWDNRKAQPPAGKQRLWVDPKVPWVCWWSWRFLYSSIALFAIGGAVIVGYGFVSMDELMSQPNQSPEQSQNP